RSTVGQRHVPAARPSSSCEGPLPSWRLASGVCRASSALADEGTFAFSRPMGDCNVVARTNVSDGATSTLQVRRSSAFAGDGAGDAIADAGVSQDGGGPREASLEEGGPPSPERGGERQRGKFLNMKNCKTIQKASQKAFKRLDELNPANLESFWTRMSQLVTRSGKRRDKQTGENLDSKVSQCLTNELGAIFDKTLAEMGTFDPRQLTQTALAFGKIIKALEGPRKGKIQGPTRKILDDLLVGEYWRRKDSLFLTIANHSVPLLPEFGPRFLSNLAYANAIAGTSPRLEDGNTLLDYIAEHSIPILETFNPYDVSNMVWAYERIGAPDPNLLESVEYEICRLDHLGEFKPQDICNLLLAFAKSVDSHPKLFRKFANHIADLASLEDFYAQDLSNMVWAYAAAEESDSRLFRKVADHICQLKNFDKFNPQNLSNTLFAFAKVGEADPRLFSKVADHIARLDNLNPFNPQNLSSTVWAYAKAEEVDPRIFQKVADRIAGLPDLNAFNSNTLSNLAWAFAKAGKADPRLFQKVADRVSGWTDLGSFNQQDLSNIVWALAEAGVDHPILFDRLADYILSNCSLDMFRSQECAQILSAFEAVGGNHDLLLDKVRGHLKETSKGYDTIFRGSDDKEILTTEEEAENNPEKE
ncbi:hypothetical protein ACHAWF_005797, partial [Thalassiosira exigua]